MSKILYIDVIFSVVEGIIFAAKPKLLTSKVLSKQENAVYPVYVCPSIISQVYM